MSVETVIDVYDLKKTFKISGGENIEVLKGLSLQAKTGEFIAIMGPSGCGKSTLLNILASIETSSSGSAVISGVNLSMANEGQLVEARRNITSIIYQSFNLLPYLTALENVMFPMMISGRSEEVARERALELLERVGLGGMDDRHPDDLSGGQQQRVAIARALANNPRVLLADEPTGNLDSRIGNSIIKLFRELTQEGIVVVMVTHDVQLSRKADRILVLRDGVLHREEEVLDE